MFWKHNPSSPQIEAVLSKEDVTLYDLMDETDILQECKSQNKKLMDFLVRPEIMEELVTLTTVEPSVDLDEKARFKYPNIACELLTSDVPALNEKLATDCSLLGKLYYFIESEPPLNPLLASYFSKTVIMLVTQRVEQVLEFLKSKENFVPLLMKHMGTSAIMDLMLKLITSVDGTEIKQSILNWLDGEEVVQSLVALFDPAVDADRQCNAAQLLSDLLVNSRESLWNCGERYDVDPIIMTLESPATATTLLTKILGSVKSESSIVSGIQVLLALLNFKRDNATSDTMAYEVEMVAAEREYRVVKSTIAAILPHLSDFHDILLNPPKKPAVPTTTGTLDPPFGNTRLQITRLIVALIATEDLELRQEIIKLGTVNVLLDLFFKYTWNNFLHTQVQHCVALALKPSSKKEETSENIMYHHIIVDCRLLGRILEAWDDNNEKQKSGKNVRQGYMGHLINIANNVQEQSETTPLGQYIKDNVCNETLTSWDKFVNEPLKEVNQTRAIVLGVVSTNSDDSLNDFDEKFFPQSASIHHHQDFMNTKHRLQPSSSQLIENFEFNENDDRAEVFLRACNWFSMQRNSGEEGEMFIDADSMDISEPWRTNETDEENLINPVTSNDPWSSARQGLEEMIMQENWADFTSALFDEGCEPPPVVDDESIKTTTVVVSAGPKVEAEEKEVSSKKDETEQLTLNNAPLEPIIVCKTNESATTQSPKEQEKTVHSDDNANAVCNESSSQPPDDKIDNLDSYMSNALSTTLEDTTPQDSAASTVDTEKLEQDEVTSTVQEVSPTTIEKEAAECTPQTPITPVSVTSPDTSESV